MPPPIQNMIATLFTTNKERLYAYDPNRRAESMSSFFEVCQKPGEILQGTSDAIHKVPPGKLSRWLLLDTNVGTGRAAWKVYGRLFTHLHVLRKGVTCLPKPGFRNATSASVDGIASTSESSGVSKQNMTI